MQIIVIAENIQAQSIANDILSQNASINEICLPIATNPLSCK